MKKFLVWMLMTALLVAPMAVVNAQERSVDPEAGTGWLYCTINGEMIEFTYLDAVKAMTGTTFNFSSEKYTLSLMFDGKLAVGEIMGENSVKAIELISSDTATAGYYATKKSTSSSVDSEVLLTQKTDDGLWQGTFKVVARAADRWVGDLRPGMLETLPLTDGEFCFRQ